jgi:hypothetical protein
VVALWQDSTSTQSYTTYDPILRKMVYLPKPGPSTYDIDNQSIAINAGLPSSEVSYYGNSGFRSQYGNGVYSLNAAFDDNVICCGRACSFNVFVRIKRLD